MIEFLVNIVKQFPVTISPSVNALLNISNNKITTFGMTQALIKEYFEVFPLSSTCILKLIYHDMFKSSAYLFEQKGRV